MAEVGVFSIFTANAFPIFGRQGERLSVVGEGGGMLGGGEGGDNV